MFKKKILIIDDSELTLATTKATLVESGYDVVTANNGANGLRMVKVEKPDLVLLDVIMPGMDGFEVCKILREDESNNLMPIVLFTANDNEEDKLVGLEMGADDYIVKPYNERELIGRVKNILKRIDRNRLANPLTGLPGNLEINAEITKRIAKEEFFAVAYSDLDNFKAYNDVYGFAAGDRAIKLTADIIVSNIELAGNAGNFVGHIGGDDFVIITSPQKVDEICNGIIEDFDKKIKELYSQEDLGNGYITTVNRLGETIQFPIMSISIAALTNEQKSYANTAEIAEKVAQVKKVAKSKNGSAYVKDRRK
jgi:diguanylate cyclase (GGDEF)-like protein